MLIGSRFESNRQTNRRRTKGEPLIRHPPQISVIPFDQKGFGLWLEIMSRICCTDGAAMIGVAAEKPQLVRAAPQLKPRSPLPHSATGVSTGLLVLQRAVRDFAEASEIVGRRDRGSQPFPWRFRQHGCTIAMQGGGAMVTRVTPRHVLLRGRFERVGEQALAIWPNRDNSSAGCGVSNAFPFRKFTDAVRLAIDDGSDCVACL
jgi:hypothetical protein